MISLKASCKNKKVEHEDREVDALILSEGEGESEGALILDQDRAFYIAKTSEDLKQTIEHLISALSNIDAQFTAMAGVGGAPANTALISTLSSFKENLK